MEIPGYEPFYLPTLDALRAEIQRLGLSIRVGENARSLVEPIIIANRQIANRWCAQPISGCDATGEGAPSDRTLRRYARLAAGGFGLIWVESTVAGRSKAGVGLHLHEATLDRFTELVASTRTASSVSSLVILQLTSAALAQDEGLTDDEVEVLRDELARAAALAARAGFDGVDIQVCHGTLAARLLRATNREGKYGGGFENRCRFLLESIAAIRPHAPSLLIASRICAYDAARNGFGVSQADYRRVDLTEPVELAQRLHAAGVTLLNVMAASPNLRGPAADRALQPRADSDPPDEHPLTSLQRQLDITGALRKAAPGMAIVGTGFSWLRQFVPQVAAAAIDDGIMDFAGLGRGALAYPGAPADFSAGERIAPEKCCILCSACSALRADSEPVGCVIRDPAHYGPVYREMRRFDPDQLIAGARRCHQCEAAPCVIASPTRTDIPGFIAAFLRGDEQSAYEIIRARDPLPELTSQLSPGWLEAEGACIETTLTGNPVPILDLQYAVSWGARDRGETGARLPAQPTGRKIAIVGGGPAGIAAAIRLLERGHSVEIWDSARRLGGVPERVIPMSRFRGLRAEMDAIFQPALAANRLTIHNGVSLGETMELTHLLDTTDAVLLATGLWQERSLGQALGVQDALSFLEAAKAGAIAIPERVAILAGGDSAMDAARVAQQLGVREIFIVFGGPRSAMHWHMPESWFAQPGVHAMMNCQPLGFELGAGGRASGLRIRHTLLGVESVLPAGLIIEAMGLGAADSVRAALSGITFSNEGHVVVDAGHRTSAERVYAAGALVNGGASVGQCVAEGLAAADSIDRDLQLTNAT